MFRWPWSRPKPARVTPLVLPDRPRPRPTEVEQAAYEPPRDLSEVEADWTPGQAFRQLHIVLCGWEDGDLYNKVLVPALPVLKPFVAQLEPHRQPGEDATFQPTFFPESLWDLYALSRVNDFLIMHFQRNAAGQHENWLLDPTGLSMDEYRRFMDQLGFTPITPRPFHPFFHEITEVTVDETLVDRVVITQEDWPGYLMGELLLSRAGVAVRVGPTSGIDAMAARSNLYFTYQRRFRATVDLSKGWGSNSQWRTDFRRDYASNGLLIYNIDGRYLLDETYEARVWAEERANVRDGDGLSLEDRISMLRHRYLVRTREDSRDFWPYHDRFVEEAD